MIVPRILGICGSPRGKSGTEYALRKALKEVEKTGVETELITLRAKEMGFCIHCDKCIREESRKCLVHDDDMTLMYDPFYYADGYIIACPVYKMSVTGQLSVFFDRLRPIWNMLKKDRAFFYNKIGGAIAVGGSRNGGQETTIERIQNFYNSLGVTIVNLGTPAFGGASLWSHSGSYEGLLTDESGLEDAKRVGERVARMVLTIAPV